jgi:prefoldin subunit 5
MRDKAMSRLEKLRHDYEVGQNQLREIEQQAATLRDALLRISGAIQVLEELLADNESTMDGSQPQSEPDVMRVP